MPVGLMLRYELFLIFGDFLLICTFQTVTLDGGEFRGLAGEFNKLMEVPMESWDMLEKMIRSTNKKSKE